MSYLLFEFGMTSNYKYWFNKKRGLENIIKHTKRKKKKSTLSQ